MQAVKEQIIASNPRSTVWLSANAGTGKTHVLINRLIRLIVDDNEPEKIICITYTTAAATEMQNRIIDYAKKWIILSDNEIKSNLKPILGNDYAISENELNNLRKKLGVILDFPERLKIQTIHSFCQSILKNFPIEADIAPFFRVMDEAEKNKILEQSFEKVFEFSYSVDDKDIKPSDSINWLLKNISPFSLKSNLNELINERLNIERIFLKYGSKNGYLKFLKEILKINNLNKSELINEFIENNSPNLKILSEAYGKASKTHQPKQQIINNFILQKDFNLISSIFLTQQGEERKDLINKNLLKEVDGLENVTKHLKNNFFVINDKIKSINLFQTTENILNVFEYINKTFENIKKQKYLLDYDDLIEKTHNLFSSKNNFLREWILYKLDGGIDHILLDEAQDTNPQQWEVIKSITEEFFSGSDTEKEKDRTLFVVGDEKQSIYSFQGADFRTFSDMKSFFKRKIESNTKADFQDIYLKLSFRSCPAILRIVDSVLENSKVSDCVTFSEKGEQQHKPFRTDHFGYFEINPLIGEKPERAKKTRISWSLPKEYKIDEEESNKKLLAKEVATKIRNILDEQRVLPSTGEPATAKDILILVKKRKHFFLPLIEELESFNIPISGLDRLNLIDNIAIKDVLSYAKFKLLPNDDLNLACLLKSPFFEISEDELFELCWNRKENSIFLTLKEKGQRDNKFLRIYESLKEILSSKSNENPLDFFLDILNIKNRNNFTSYYGKQINEIFDEFINLVSNFESSNTASLQKLINFLENNNSEIKRNQEVQKNEVRIMTIHGAKGLQAPIVIIPDTTSRSKIRTSNIINSEIILCPGSSDNKNKLLEELQKHKRSREDEEDKRLLYVALTRAKDEMYIFGDKSEDFEKDDCWYNIIKESAKKICNQDENERLFLTNEEYLNYALKNKEENQINLEITNKNTIPDFLYKELTSLLSQDILRPSDFYEKENKNNKNNILNSVNKLEKGNFIHKLLEILPNKEKGKWSDYINIISKNYDLDANEIEQYSKEVINVISNPEFKFIFRNKNSLNEASLCGKNKDGAFISGQIDRLVELNQKTILIIDYKTTIISKNEAELKANSYFKQLYEYEKLLRNIYPDKDIKKAILFTHINSLVYI